MTNTIPNALRILSHFWLEEIQPSDLDTIAALPSLAETLPSLTETALTDLAVEYQRLFGFNLPPYESIFVDPSVMLQAPSTARVQALYQQGGWAQLPKMRAGAPDHIGVELRVLADWLLMRKLDLASQLLTQHLAVWLPTFVLTLRRLAPHPFYAELSELTMALVLDLLSESLESNPSGLPEVLKKSVLFKAEALDSERADESDEISLRHVIKRLLMPCNIGLYLTREDIARVSQKQQLSVSMGDRYRMLETLFHQAGQYELVPALLDGFVERFDRAEAEYRVLAAEYPAWESYALIWFGRASETKRNLIEMLKLVLAE